VPGPVEPERHGAYSSGFSNREIDYLIIGIGVDLIEVDRVAQLLTRHPERGKDRLYTESEIAYCGCSRRPAESFAARFAAKEAFFKAIGTGWGTGGEWREVEVRTGELGAPSLELHGKAAQIAADRGVQRVHLTLTHTGGMACAFVVLEGDTDPNGSRPESRLDPVAPSSS
jgi:holo-[acyl-carrier protein] synthase